MALLPLLLLLAGWLSDSQAWVQDTDTNGVRLSWPNSQAIIHLNLGSSRWNNAAEGTLAKWNAAGSNFRFRLPGTHRRVGQSCNNPDNINTVVWGSTQCGMRWEEQTLAITNTWSRGGRIFDTDVIFNNTKNWDVYRGPLRRGVADLRRVALHEFGHVLGLDHPDEHGQSVRAIMHSLANDNDRLQTDDINGIRAIYGDGGGGGNCGRDPGGTRQGATVVRLPSDTRACLERGGDVDYFRFSVPQAGTLTAETTGSTDTRGWLGTSTRTLTTDDDSGSSSNFRLSQQITTPGTYYVRVSGYSTATTGAYTLRLRFTIGGGGNCGRDPGGTRQGATVVRLPSDTRACLERGGDVDYFRFSVPQAGTLTAETTGSTDTRGWLGTSTRTLTTDDDSGSSSNFRLSQQITTPGTYYVRVSGYSTATTGAYTLRLRFTIGGGGNCGRDPGGTRQGATVVRLPSDTRACLERGGDVDYFRFSVPQAGTLTAETTGSTDTRGWLGTSTRTLTTDDDSGSSSNFRLSQQITTPGTYYVRVSGYSTATTGAYTLRLRFTIGGGGNCGRDPGGTRQGATVVRLPSDTRACLERGGDVDYFRFSVPQAGTLTAETTGSTDTRGWLGTSTRTLTTDDDSGSSSNFRLSQQITTPGTYYVRVSGYSTATTGAYTLRLRFTIGGGGNCGRDPGGTRQGATVVRLPSDTRACLERGGDVDYFRFSVPQAGTLYVDTTGSTDTVGHLRSGQDGRWLTTDDDSGSSRNFRLSQQITTPGTYYVRVSGDSTTTTGAYTLRLRFTIGGGGNCGSDPGGTWQGAAVIRLATDTRACLERRGDVDYFRFYVPRTGTLYVDTTGSTDTVGHLRSGQDGRWLTTDDDSGSSRNFRLSQQITTPGTYYVRVSGDSTTTTGAYTLRLRFTIGGGGNCGSDPGGTWQGAAVIRLATDTRACLERRGDVDYFRFYVPRTGTLYVDTTGSTDTVGHLRSGQDGRWLTTDDDSGSSRNFRLSQQITTPGTYYVRVSGYASTATGSYTLRVRFTAR